MSPDNTTAWWSRLDPFLGASLCMASLLSLTLLIGTCLCLQRRKKQQHQRQQEQADQLDFVAVNGKCVLDDTSPALSAVFINNNKLHQACSPYYCTGSLPRHVEAHQGSPAHMGSPSGASSMLLCNGSAATLPRRFSSGAGGPPSSAQAALMLASNGAGSCGCHPPRFEAQLSRSSQCDRELPPVPPPEKLTGENNGMETGSEIIRSRIEAAPEEVTELEEEEDSQYDLIARSPSSGLARATPTATASSSVSAAAAASASHLTGPLPANSLAAMAASASAGSLNPVPPGVNGGANGVDGVVGGGVGRCGRTMTTATLDSDAGSEVDPLYACIRPGRTNSASRLAAQGRSSSLASAATPLHEAQQMRGEAHGEEGGQLHVYSFIRKQMSSPVYQLLPRHSAALPGLPRSLRGSVESYASLGASYASHPNAPSVPDRRYGQSEIDLVEQLRKNAADSAAAAAAASALTGSAGGISGRHRRRSQSGVLLRHVAERRANWALVQDGAGGAAARGMAVDGRQAALLDEERRHSQPALVSDELMTDHSGSGGGAGSSETQSTNREASYQRVTVRESLASLRARNALPQTSNPAANNAGLQSLSLTDDTSSLYERLDHHSAGSHRRSFGPSFGARHPMAQPLLPPRSAALSEAGDFYAEISGDDEEEEEEEPSEAYGEGEVVSSVNVGLGPLRHSQSGPLRLGAAAVAVHAGAGADRVMFEMRSFRHIDSDLDISQTGTPVSARRGFSRPLSPPPESAAVGGIAPLAHQRRSLMTPLMERSIEGSLFDDGASSMLTETTANGGPPTFGYRTSPSSDYERLPIAPSDGPSTLAPLDSSHEALGRSEADLEAELDAMDEDFLDTSEAMTDSGMSYGEAGLPSGSSLPVLLPSPALIRPHRFPPAAPSRSADNSSGIASRASQSSSGEPSVTGSPPSHSALSSASSGGGGGFGAARVGRQLVAQLLHSFRKKAKPAAGSGAMPATAAAVVGRHRTASDSSSIL